MRFVVLAPAIAAAALAGVRPAAAQVIVPPSGEGTVNLVVQHYRHTGHFDKDGNKTYNTSTDTQTLLGQIDVGLPGEFGLTVSLPLIASKYTGPQIYFVPPGIETHAGPLDNGKYHAAVQDLHVEVRRMFTAGPVVVAPLVGFGLPTHEYETIGESAPGRHRTELQAGVGASTTIVPRTELHGRYAYATLEHVDGNDFPSTRSNIDVDADVSVLSHLSLQGFMGFQVGHERPTTQQLLPIWREHDRYITANFLNVGGGATWALTRTTDVFVFGITTVRGRFGAHIERAFAIGVSKTFGDSFGGFGG